MTLIKVRCENTSCPWNTGHGRCDADEIDVDEFGECMTQSE